MGEALLREALVGQDVTVGSAGLGALVGYPADPIAVDLMGARGLDIRSHRARQLDAAKLRDTDLILVMDSGHTERLTATLPHGRGKVHLLGRWGDFEIPDPYQRPRAEFEQALALIERGVADWVDRLGRL